MWNQSVHRTITWDHFLPKLKKRVRRSGQRRMRISNVPTVKSLLPVFWQAFFRAEWQTAGRSECRGYQCRFPRINFPSGSATFQEI
jgi:hypothetical protein